MSGHEKTGGGAAKELSWDSRPRQDISIRLGLPYLFGFSIDYTYASTAEELKSKLARDLLERKAIDRAEVSLIEEMDFEKADNYLRIYAPNPIRSVSFLEVISACKYESTGTVAYLVNRDIEQNEQLLSGGDRCFLSLGGSYPALEYAANDSPEKLTDRLINMLQTIKAFDYAQAKYLKQMSVEQLNEVFSISDDGGRVPYSDFCKMTTREKEHLRVPGFALTALAVHTILRRAKSPETNLFNIVMDCYLEDEAEREALQAPHQYYSAMWEMLDRIRFGQLALKSERAQYLVGKSLLSDLKEMKESCPAYRQDALFPVLETLVRKDISEIPQFQVFKAQVKTAITPALKKMRGSNFGPGLVRSIITKYLDPGSLEGFFYVGGVLPQQSVAVSATSVLCAGGGGENASSPGASTQATRK